MNLTKREREVLDELVRCHTLKGVANKLNVSPSTVYNLLYRIRKKNDSARKFVNTVLAYRRRHPRLDMVLSHRITVEEEDA